MDSQDHPGIAISTTEATNVIRNFLERLEEKRMLEQIENGEQLYRPTPDEMTTFLHVLDWIRDHSTSYTGSIDFDEHNLSITIDHQTDSKYYEDEEIMTDSLLSVSATMNYTYSFIFGPDEAADDLRCLAFQSLMDKLSTENFPEGEEEGNETL